MLPLIRLIVHYHVERQAINVIKFGQKFTDKVANAEDMIVLKPFKIREKTSKEDKAELEEAFGEVSCSHYFFYLYLESLPLLIFGDKIEWTHWLFQEDQWADKVEDIVKKYYETNKKKEPVVHSVNGITEAVSRFINMRDTDAIECMAT